MPSILNKVVKIHHCKNTLKRVCRPTQRKSNQWCSEAISKSCNKATQGESRKPASTLTLTPNKPIFLLFPSAVWSNFHVFLVSLACYQCSWRLFCPKHPLPPFLMFCPNLQPDALLESDKFLDLCTLWFTSLPIILIVAKSTRKMLSAMLYPDLENKYISPPIIILSASVGCLFLP